MIFRFEALALTTVRAMPPGVLSAGFWVIVKFLFVFVRSYQFSSPTFACVMLPAGSMVKVSGAAMEL